MGPAVSARPVGRNPRARESYGDALSRLPHLKYLELDHQGYVILDLTRERVQARWIFTRYSDERSSEERVGAVFESAAGANRLRRVEAGDPLRAVT